MDDFVTIKLKGGLGNFLFQIATAFSYSVKHNKKLLLNINDVYIVHNNINNYTDNLFSKINFLNYTPSYESNYNELSFEYNEIPYFDDSLCLDGYFQSEKYFLDNREKILDLFDFGEKTKKKIKEKYYDIIDKNTCSVHFRRGDYLNFPDIHPTLPMEYYIKSFEKFNEDTIFLIFSDDINWCKENLITLNKKLVFIENNSDFEDLYLMSCCKNNIICNSTFSWWGAWLNINPYRRVIIPSTWFGNKLIHYNINDLICENWEKI